MLMRGRSCLFHSSEAPRNDHHRYGPTLSLLSSSRTIGPSAMASASGASVSNGRASSACPRNKSGQTGAPHRKWSDGSPICLGSWRAVRAIPSGREPSISVTPSSASTEPTSRRRSGTPFPVGLLSPRRRRNVIDLYDRIASRSAAAAAQEAKVLVRQRRPTFPDANEGFEGRGVCAG